MIWNVMVKANWIRDRRSAVISIAILLACARRNNWMPFALEVDRGGQGQLPEGSNRTTEHY
jgi:hypothetical protein